MSTKLSKRKQKALAFQGKNKSKSEDANIDEEAKAIPQEDNEITTSWLGKDATQGPSTKLKRKRDEEQPSQTNATTPQTKKPKTKKPKAITTDKAQAQKRFIVFVGNLPHLPSTELQLAIQSHFPDPPTSIRIPTKKGTNAPQGFAFLEFDNSTSLEKALRCHHTMLMKRKINVELTAGGGGKSDTRMAKVKGKNEALEEERKKRMEEEKKGKAKEGETEGIHPDRLKRIKGST